MCEPRSPSFGLRALKPRDCLYIAETRLFIYLPRLLIYHRDCSYITETVYIARVRLFIYVTETICESIYITGAGARIPRSVYMRELFIYHRSRDKNTEICLYARTVYISPKQRDYIIAETTRLYITGFLYLYY